MTARRFDGNDPRWWPWAVIGVLGMALALRLVAASSTDFIADERQLLDYATGAAGADETTPLALNHPPLALLLMRLPLALGLESPAEVRLPFVLLSVIGLICAYLLARRAFGRWPALIALVLLSVDQFHLIRSRTATEALALAFVAPILYAFYRAVIDDRPNLMLVVGVLAGVGYYGKEDTLLLLPAMGLFLLVKRSRRRWFRRKELYLGLLVVLAFISMDVYFNASGSSRNLPRISERVVSLGLTLRATSLYLGELLIQLVDEPVLFVDDWDMWSVEVPAMNWVAGLLCLAAAVYATDKYRDEGTSLLLWVFWLVFAAVSLVQVPRTPLAVAAGAPSPGFFELDLKKWAGTSLIPAAILAGDLVYRRVRRWRPGQVLAAVLLAYLIGNGFLISLKREPNYLPPLRVQNSENRSPASTP